MRNATIVDAEDYPRGSHATVDARDVYYDTTKGVLYVADGSAGIRVLRDNGTGVSMTELALVNTPGSAKGITMYRDHLCVAVAAGGMQIVDISNPNEPVLRGRSDTPGCAEDVLGFRYPPHILVADGEQGLALIDALTFDHPNWSGSGSATTGYAQGLVSTTVGRKSILLMAIGSGLLVFDISEIPFRNVFPKLLGKLDDIIALDVDTFQTFAFAAGGSRGLEVIELNPPRRPQETKIFKTQGYAMGVKVYDRKLWVSVQTGGVDVLQIAWLPNDYNGDGVSDLAAYELSTGNWFISSLGPVGPANPPIAFGENWGGSGLLPVPGDFNGDFVGDLAVYDQSTGGWFVKSIGSDVAMVFADILGGPDATAFWGDGLLSGSEGDTLCIYDAAIDGGFTFVLTSRSGAFYPWEMPLPDARPVPGDYDGDGATDCALYEPATGKWWIRGTRKGLMLVDGENWGGPGLVPVCGDFDGDTRFDMAVYELATGNWYIKSLWKTAPITFGQNWGASGLFPVPGDFNGDGVWDLSTYETSTGNWFIRSLGPGDPITFGQNWGGPGLVPPGLVQ